MTRHRCLAIELPLMRLLLCQAGPGGRAELPANFHWSNRRPSMMTRGSLLAVAILAGTIAAATPVTSASAESGNQITIVYDAFGTDSTMTKDWGFSALVEIAGKRILFDTGDNADIFAANVKAKG